MQKSPSLPENLNLMDAVSAHPEGFDHLCDYHDVILREPSLITIAERELIAAYVPGLNQCNFCRGSHRAFAEVDGIDPDIFEQLIAGPEKSEVDEKLLPTLAFGRKSGS